MVQRTVFPVAAILASIRKSLRDEQGLVFDTDTELLPLLNDAVAEIVNNDELALIYSGPYQVAPFMASVASGGSGAGLGDVLTLQGGAYSTPARVVVSGLDSAGGVASVTAIDFGSYTAYPPNPVSTIGGTGSGITVSLRAVGGKQEIPPDGVNLVSIIRNLGTDGQTIGSNIEMCAYDDITSFRPQWTTDVCGVGGMPAAPVHYIPAENDPKRFFLWPYPNVMQTPCYVEMAYRVVPDDIQAVDNFPLPALYIPAAKYYVIGHAMLRLDNSDARWGRSRELAPLYLQMFKDAVASEREAEKASQPPRRINRGY